MRDTILAVCHERGDASETGQARLLNVHYFHAVDAVYHKVCSINFRTKKQIPAVHKHEGNTSKRAKVGRPQYEERRDAFLEVARFLEENDDEQITIKDLVSRMENNLADSEHSAYSHTHMQLKLQEHFGDRVVTFRNKAKAVLRYFYSQNEKADPDTDKARIVEAAAKLIRDDIKAVETPHGVYPGCDELGLMKPSAFCPKA